MDRNYIKEMLCLEAYTALRDGAVNALKLLREGKTEEAEEELSQAIHSGEVIMDRSCEAYFFTNSE